MPDVTAPLSVSPPSSFSPPSGITPPRREFRAPQACVVISNEVTMAEMVTKLPPCSPELVRWLADRGQAPAGPAFWRYRVIDMAGQLAIDVGFPVDGTVVGDDRVKADVLPGGSYIVTRFRGHPDGLEQATGDLLDWAKAEGVAWDAEPHAAGEAWRSRIEWYLSDDDVDMADWITELAFLTR